MKEWLINLAGGLFGLKALWEKVDGWKTYIGAAAQMLAGLGAMATSAGAVLSDFLTHVHSLGEAYTWFQALKTDPGALACAAGWAVFWHGWIAAGQRHAIEKAAVEAPTPPPTVP